LVSSSVRPATFTFVVLGTATNELLVIGARSRPQ